MKLVCNLRKIAFDKNIDNKAELGRIIGISKPTLYKMYDNKNLGTIKLESFIKVCDALKLTSLSELIEYK